MLTHLKVPFLLAAVEIFLGHLQGHSSALIYGLRLVDSVQKCTGHQQQARHQGNCYLFDAS